MCRLILFSVDEMGLAVEVLVDPVETVDDVAATTADATCRAIC